jgi:alkylation response protein AidB-like acyl-CoA dehydrogenase
MKLSEKERQLFREVAVKTAERIQPRAAEIDATGEFPRDSLKPLGNRAFFPSSFRKSMPETVAISLRFAS